VNVFAYVERGTVHVEGYFPDGKPAGNAAIQVLDSGGRRLLEGRTDAEGLFSFPLPKKDDLTIVIDASMGHRNQFLLKKQDLGD
jgi:nickel transport protein